MLTVETRPYLETFLRVNDFVEPIFLTNSYRVKSCLSVKLNKNIHNFLGRFIMIAKKFSSFQSLSSEV